MESLDIEALLKKNPKVDRGQIEHLKKERIPGQPIVREGDPTSPYRGRRATSDDKMNWTERNVTACDKRTAYPRF